MRERERDNWHRLTSEGGSDGVVPAASRFPAPPHRDECASTVRDRADSAGPDEYGFYSNVNPDVDHPRWSQSMEQRIGEYGGRPTLLFNGYGEQVAHLYQGMDLRKYY